MSKTVVSDTSPLVWGIIAVLFSVGALASFVGATYWLLAGGKTMGAILALIGGSAAWSSVVFWRTTLALRRRETDRSGQV
jgi:hypothetical protein